MILIGFLLILIGLPLLIGYYIGQKKNVMWRNLGIITIIVGVLLMAVR